MPPATLALSRWPTRAPARPRTIWPMCAAAIGRAGCCRLPATSGRAWAVGGGLEGVAGKGCGGPDDYIVTPAAAPATG
eukprot:scaffold103072_cov47-Phaeocystis_antarctica.AAC.2